jgi:Ser/Thr protein kinase RdoA (MazF antagonist)
VQFLCYHGATTVPNWSKTMSITTAKLASSDAEALVRELYGMAAAAHPLPGEYDANFHLRAHDGAEYTLKVMHPAAVHAVVELQIAVLEHLARRDPHLPAPRVVPSTRNQPLEYNGERLVWLLRYLPGRLLAETRPHTPELLEDLGAYLGRLDAALADFAHPAAQRELKWDLARAGWISAHLDVIGDTRRRAIVERVLDRYVTHIAPLLPELRHGVIHNDANDYNVLVSGAREWPQRVAGVIDFGDALRTATVCEPAIAAAYALLGKSAPLTAAARVSAIRSKIAAVSASRSTFAGSAPSSRLPTLRSSGASRACVRSMPSTGAKWWVFAASQLVIRGPSGAGAKPQAARKV